MKLKTLSIFLLCFCGFANARPHWTEKSSFEEGDKVYFVGVSTNRKTMEEARTSALKAARAELSSYLQIPYPTGLTFHTQMTFDEKNEDGTVSVYRLMWVDKKDLEIIQSGLSLIRPTNVSRGTRKMVPLGSSPWRVGIPIEFTGLPVDFPGSSMFVVGFGLTGEREIVGGLSLRASIFYEVGLGSRQDFNGFKYEVGVPYYFTPSFFLSLEGGFTNSSYTQRSTGTAQAFKLQQTYYGGGPGFLFRGENIAGQIKASLQKFSNDAGLAGRTAFLLSVGVAVDPGL